MSKLFPIICILPLTIHMAHAHADVNSATKKYVAQCNEESETLIEVKWKMIERMHESNQTALDPHLRYKLLDNEKLRCKASKVLSISRTMASNIEQRPGDPKINAVLKKMLEEDVNLMSDALKKTGEIK